MADMIIKRSLNIFHEIWEEENGSFVLKVRRDNAKELEFVLHLLIRIINCVYNLKDMFYIYLI